MHGPINGTPPMSPPETLAKWSGLRKLNQFARRA
jgi:hypothetical protein